MLHHIVIWKMRGETSDERRERAETVAAALRPLAESVPTVRKLDVRINELDGYNNFDVALISEFDDVAGFEAYVIHPEHQAVVKIIGENAEVRAGLDYTA